MNSLSLSRLILAPAGSPAAMYLASLSRRSQRVMSDNLQRVAAWISDGHDDAYTLPWHLCDKSTFIRAQTYFSRRYSAAKVNQMMYAVRGTLRAACQMGLISKETYWNVTAFEMLRENHKPKGRILKGAEIKRIFACCDEGATKGVRDAAIIAVLLGAGLKRSEVATLQRQNYDEETGKITLIDAKNQQRHIIIEPPLNKHIDVWIEIRGAEEGALFYPISKSGTIKRHAMRDQSILDIVMERGKQAGVEPISPHDFRRTFAARQLGKGTKLEALQQQMGHSNIATTGAYAQP